MILRISQKYEDFECKLLGYNKIFMMLKERLCGRET